MANEQDINDDQPQDPEYVKPNPALNPRNIAANEIAKARAAQAVTEAAETAPTIDDDHNVSDAPEPVEEPQVAEAAENLPEDSPTEPAPSSEPSVSAASPTAIDPAAEYEVEVEGQKIKVPGSKIIDAGFRTFSKEASADFRLNVASQLLREAEAKFAAATQPGAAPTQPREEAQPEVSDADLAKALQFGTPEQAAEALKTLRGRGAISPEAIQKFVVENTRMAARDEYLFQQGQDFVNTEYADLMANPMIKRLFQVEESRRRAPKERGGEGDNRPYKELYQTIGDDLRKQLNLPKPGAKPSGASSTVSTTATRVAAKRAAAPVPRTASARLESVGATPKVKTNSEIIAGMAELRGKNQLTPRRATKE